MGWSNSIPQQIQTLQDGTTQFNGPIVVTDPNGNTEASIGIDGSISGNRLTVNTISLNGIDVGNTLTNLPTGLIGYNSMATNSNTVNNGTTYLMMLTNAFPLQAGRIYEFASNACRGNWVQSGSTVDVWELQLVLYYFYPTAANYTSPSVKLDAVVMDLSSTTASSDQVWPGLTNIGDFGTHATVYMGVLLHRAAGAGTMYINASYSPFNIWVLDRGNFHQSANGIFDPIPYVGGTPPPPPPVHHTLRRYATWSRSYDQYGNPYVNNSVETDKMYQGYDPYDTLHGLSHAAWNFDYSAIASDLSGATNIQGVIGIYIDHSWNSGGPTIDFYSHNTRSGSAPSTYSGIIGLTDQYGGIIGSNPGWCYIRVDSIMAAWSANLISGFAFGINSTDTAYYMYADGASSANKPFLDLAWDK